MKVRRMLSLIAVVVSGVGSVGGPALADRLPEAGTGGGQPLASGQLFGEDAHGAIHCQAVARLFVDPDVAPGTAPGAIVITPNGPQFGGPREGLCAQFYTVFTGQQP
jgi:hypothetical protein